MERNAAMKTRFALIKCAALLALLYILNFQSTALGAAGDLDTFLAGTGKLRTGFGGGVDQAYAVAAQADGKLVMAGFSVTNYYPYGTPVFSLVRLDTNNALDASFGNGGKVLTPVSLAGLPNTAAGANAVSIQADGKIVAAGYAYIGTNYPTFTVVRYNPDGSPDTTFGTSGTGIVYTDLGQQSEISAMQIQSDGAIVVAGTGFALARYQTNGTLDASFGTGGTVVAAGPGVAANGMMIQSDGKIVAVGTGTGIGHNGEDFAVFRFTTNGVLDSTFGGGTGEVFTQISTNNSGYFDSAVAVATQYGKGGPFGPDRIVVAGTYQDNPFPTHTYFALARYGLDGTLDTSFGTGGIVRNPITSGTASDDGDFGVSLVVQSGFGQPQTINVGGYSSANGTNYFTLARYTFAGAFDTTFGTNGNGTVTIPFGPGVDAKANAMAVQSGQFVLAGYAGVSGHNYDFAAARFNQDGSSDTNFANGGVLSVDVDDLDSSAQGVAIQPDGRMVVAGNANNSTNEAFALARFNADGSPDTSFGLNGKLLTVVGTNDSAANAVQIQPDGKIVAAGAANFGTNFAVVRYNANGTLDTDFGDTGKVLTPVGGSVTAMAIQPDGKIVVTGTGNTQANPRHFVVARYTTNGALDATFGGGTGLVSTSIGIGGDTAGAVRIQNDGKIVVAGSSTFFTSVDFSLVRYNTNGSLDISFGSFGRVTTDFGSANGGIVSGLAIQPDGRIIAAGQAEIPVVTGGSEYFALARYTTNGALDASFGSGGEVITQVGFDTANVKSVALQPDGKIVAAGLSLIGTNDQYAVVRYNPDGSLDNSYGTGGEVLVSFDDGGSDSGAAVALDQTGRAVVVGNANGLFGVMRLLGDVAPGISLAISLTSSNTAIVYWPSSSTGWNLQQNTDLGTSNWVAPAETTNNDGTNNFIVINPPAGNRFFRLFKP
jgi:uncharacterized delta-60 repeat protein